MTFTKLGFSPRFFGFHALNASHVAHTNPTPQYLPGRRRRRGEPRVSKVEPDFQALNRSSCPKVSIFKRGLYLLNRVCGGGGTDCLREHGDQAPSF
jgi:hypothetical protein